MTTLTRKQDRTYGPKEYTEGEHQTDTRSAFVDWLDAMQKGGQISQELAQRATLAG